MNCIDMSEIKSFFENMKSAGKGALQKELEVFLEALAEEFLNLIQEEFKNRHKNTGFGFLISSFSRGGAGNVWRYEDENLTIEVGTVLKYAGYVNDGHRTLDPAKTRHFKLPNGERARYVPGYWQKKKFICDPSSKTGMVLKYKWVEGLHFWEAALTAIKRTCPQLLEKKLDEWLEKYF